MRRADRLNERPADRELVAGKSIEQRAKRILWHLVRRLSAEPHPIRAEALHGSRRILLIRPNFRIGNAAISTALIAGFRARFPQARIDFLATDRTRSVLLEQPVDRVYTLSRRDLHRPWRYLSLLRVLRRNRYDLAVQTNSGSLTNDLIIRLAGACYTMGPGEGERRRYHLQISGVEDHAYDNALHFARALGGSCPDRPVIHLTEAERREALKQLRMLPAACRDRPFCALFVGGHGAKRWPLDDWLALIRILEANGHRFVVFFGPEEPRVGNWLHERTADCRNGIVLQPRPLREFCALLSFAHCVVTPDSGPMHLAAGLGVPIIALVRARASLRYVPRGERDLTLIDPDAAQVHEALAESLRNR